MRNDSDWISVKDKLPNLGEFVEVIYPDDSRLTETNRDFAAHWKDDTGYFWTSASMDERVWSKKGFGIKFWRPMSPDHRGRKIYIKTDKNHFFRVYKKKIER